MVRTKDTSLLEAALVGYQAEAAKITAAIADLQKRLGKRANGHVPGTFPNAPVAHQVHRISAAGRARIAEAQRKRWAAAKKEKAK
jgi:hypothetical protein